MCVELLHHHESVLLMHHTLLQHPAKHNVASDISQAVRLDVSVCVRARACVYGGGGRKPGLRLQLGLACDSVCVCVFVCASVCVLGPSREFTLRQRHPRDKPGLARKVGVQGVCSCVCLRLYMRACVRVCVCPSGKDGYTTITTDSMCPKEAAHVERQHKRQHMLHIDTRME